MTAGVQNLEPAAYIAPPPAAPSNAKGTVPAEHQTSNSPSESSSFQSELQRQDASPKENKSPDRRGTGSTTSGSAKPAKNGDKNPSNPNPTAATPAQPTEPPKPILPLALALASPDKPAQTDAQAKEPPPSGQSTQPRPTTPENVAAPATPDPSQNLVLPLAAVVPATEATKSADQPAASPDPGISSQSQALPPADLKLPEAAPPEPVAAAIQETVDSTPSSSSALAFAARMTAVQPTAAAGAVESPTPQVAADSSSTPIRIPLRYAATAQILQNADPLHADTGSPPVDRTSTPGLRMDMVVPRLESSNTAASSSAPAAPQEVAPTARLEQVIEPPAAPPNSAHDIQVRVPDNNGGSTQVRFVESGGEVRVSVRTADDGLAQSLRGHLNDLTQRLSDGGIPAEIWKPAPSAASSQNDQHPSERQGSGSGGQQSGGQGGQQDRQQKRPAWLDEMEASLDAAKE